MRNINVSVARRTTSPFNSAFHTPHSAFLSFSPVRQRKTQRLELERHVDRLHHHVAGPADQHDAVRASQAQDVANPRGELRDRIAQAALAERAEEREVLAHLRRGGAAAPGQLGGGDGGLALRVELLEEPEVQGEPSHGALGDLPHCELFHNRTLQRKSRTNISGASVSGRAAGSSPSAASPAVTTAAERPVAAITTLRSCLRRRVKQAVTNARNAAISSGATSGCASGVRRSTALVTLGGGVNAPACTVKSRSTRATACTPTDRAPYVLDPGDAAIRSATSAWTRNTIRAGRGGVRALSIRGEVMAYGILPITLNAGCVASETSACQSRRSESPSTSATFPDSPIPHPASRIPTTSRGSFSIAMTRATRGARTAVKVPVPAPISTTTSSGAGSSASTM